VADGKGKSKGSEEESTLISLSNPVSQVFKNIRLARVEQLQGPGAPREFVLHSTEMVFGRSEDADCTLDSVLLSRRHIVFRKNGVSVRCEDLNSSNGMYLNGARAHAADLHEGDTIQIGDVVLMFHEGQ
jgi:pSer/pThr/pTyr-binding forkhead associated (FHA) protein